MEEGANAKMEEFISETAALTGVDYSCVMVKGIADDEIIKYANENDIDMIVIGTHGRTGFEHVIFGSTAEKVVRAASCPVLTVHCQKIVLSTGRWFRFRPFFILSRHPKEQNDIKS